jgi:hypothetical protein
MAQVRNAARKETEKQRPRAEDQVNKLDLGAVVASRGIGRHDFYRETRSLFPPYHLRDLVRVKV